MPKSKAENHKEAIMSSVEEETETEAIAAAAKAAKEISVERVVRADELSALVEKALDGLGEPFRLTFDDGSCLYLSHRWTGGSIASSTPLLDCTEKNRC